jgi:hypothetical protein
LVKNCTPAAARKDFLPINIEMLFESCVAECFSFSNNQKLLIRVIYCTPSASQVEFIDRFETLLDKLASLNTSYLVMGYFNFNLMSLVSVSE